MHKMPLLYLFLLLLAVISIAFFLSHDNHESKVTTINLLNNIGSRYIGNEGYLIVVNISNSRKKFAGPVMGYLNYSTVDEVTDFSGGTSFLAVIFPNSLIAMHEFKDVPPNSIFSYEVYNQTVSNFTNISNYGIKIKLYEIKDILSPNNQNISVLDYASVFLFNNTIYSCISSHEDFCKNASTYATLLLNSSS